MGAWSRRFYIAALVAALGLAAWAGEAREPGASLGQRVAASARWYLQNPSSTTSRQDCSGLVQAVLARAGIRARGGTSNLWRRAKREQRVAEEPQPGDLAFFDHTYDANENGRRDDPLSHVAVVVSTLADGTVVMVHRSSGVIRRLRLNLRHGDQHRHHGRVVNDYLANATYAGAPSQRLSAQLLRGFARPPTAHTK